MAVNQFEIWIADLNPQLGTEAGKTRPVLVVQTDLLNEFDHASTLVCPITTNVQKNSELLRIHLASGSTNLAEPCDVMIDQIRAIDNKRLIKRVSSLPAELRENVKESLRIILDLE